jgi:hypothetical protein
MQVIYTHEYNKRHPSKVRISIPAISYITSSSLAAMEEHLYNNGPLTDVEEDDADDEAEDDKNDEVDANVRDEEVDVVNMLVTMQEKPMEDDYTLPLGRTPQKRITIEEEDVDEEGDWRQYEMSTQTQQMFEYSETQPQLSLVEKGREAEYEASMKAKKVQQTHSHT